MTKTVVGWVAKFRAEPRGGALPSASAVLIAVLGILALIVMIVRQSLCSIPNLNRVYEP